MQYLLEFVRKNCHPVSFNSYLFTDMVFLVILLHHMQQIFVLYHYKVFFHVRRLNKIFLTCIVLINKSTSKTKPLQRFYLISFPQYSFCGSLISNLNICPFVETIVNEAKFAVYIFVYKSSVQTRQGLLTQDYINDDV